MLYELMVRCIKARDLTVIISYAQSLAQKRFTSGLDSVAIGQIPLSVSGTSEPYTVQGSGAIDFADTLAAEWGSYAVTLNMDGVIAETWTGSDGAETLHLKAELSGDQLVVVTTGLGTTEYPWNGTHNFDLDFPVMDGATVQGEGWAFTLHINGG